MGSSPICPANWRVNIGGSRVSMIQILRKKGWMLNPNDKIVNTILKRCEANNGNCPCMNNSREPKCPCSDYRENDICHCTLYVKMEGKS